MFAVILGKQRNERALAARSGSRCLAASLLGALIGKAIATRWRRGDAEGAALARNHALDSNFDAERGNHMRVQSPLLLVVVSVGPMACAGVQGRAPDPSGASPQGSSTAASGSGQKRDPQTGRDGHRDGDDDGDDGSSRGPDLVARVAGQAATLALPAPAAAVASGLLWPTRNRLVIELGAAGLAGVAGGLVFGAKARANFHDAKELCGAHLTCNTRLDYDRATQLVGDARSDAAISTLLVAAGGAAIAASVLLAITAPTTRSRAAAAIVPAIHDHGTGIAVVGSF